MPSSPIFICLKSTHILYMSLKQTRLHLPHRLLRPSPLPAAVGGRDHAQSFILLRRSKPTFPFACSASSSSVNSPFILKRRNSSASLPYFYNQSFPYGRYAYDEYAPEEESDIEFQSGQQLGASTLENIEEWKWKLTMLIRNKDEQEVVSREKKDRRDFEQLSALATRMGLCSHQYVKVVVISKVPLPNYRSDLDDKRPQREVVLGYGLQDRLDAHLKQYLARKPTSKEFLLDNAFSRSSSGGYLATNEGLYEQEEPITKISVVAERILQRKSLEIRNKQQNWQESSEGQTMQEFRKTLPAYKEKDSLLNMISQNQVVVVSGETGCGKTTQLPQYILEAEVEAARGASCNIICTQPRRISAMSVAERVASERGEKLGESVGYKVRLEGMRGRDTRLLFCTTGILLRRLLVDRKLKGVTHVIVDEIHERGMNEDFLLIVLKDLLPRRPELRLILMSATLNAELFSSYFSGAPMIHIPGFTYPVRSLFLENILEMTGYRLTTYNQIDNYGQDKMWKMQKQTLRKRKSQIASSVEDALEAVDFREYSPRIRESLSCWNPDSIGFNLIEHVLDHICRKERPGAILVFMTGWDDINSLKCQLEAHPLLGDPSKVLLLACHGSMDSSEQRLIFNKPEEGVRKIVLATNMAETSITINDVVFVVDCGKAKETSYDALNNTPCLLPSWISKASARQRRGRAGRVQPGECYHLYPRCVHDAFADYQLPELLRTPLQSLCLQIKSLQLGSISEFLSRALQPPEPLSVQNAIEYLKIIGALDEYEHLTVLGHNLSMLPVEPKLGKMLILGAIFNCLNPIMTVVAGLSVRDPFLTPLDKKDLAESAKAQFSARDFSDHLALVWAYDGWNDAEKRQAGYEYCWRNFLSTQTLRAIDSLRKQFFYLLKDTGLVDNVESCNTWSHDEHLIRAITCAGLFPRICPVVLIGCILRIKQLLNNVRLFSEAFAILLQVTGPMHREVANCCHKWARPVQGDKCDMLMEFVKDFKGAAQVLEKGGYTQFTPLYITWNCPMAFTVRKQCKSQCINQGRYCAPDPEQDFSSGYEGKDVVLENLRHLCVFKVANESQKPWVWWDYVTDFQIRCPMREKKYNKECAGSVIKSLGLDSKKIEKCMRDPNADSDNPVLKEEQDAQVGKGSRGDVTILLTLVVNNRQYRGKLAKGAILKAICSCFEETTEPSVCLSGDVETNECMDKNGGCWQDKFSNITACKDTFRGRVCECPLVDSVQFKGVCQISVLRLRKTRDEIMKCTLSIYVDIYFD